jgi:SAM-dependent methyltransferase
MLDRISATDVQLGQPICPMPPSEINRYSRNAHWRLYEKEWIFRNFPPGGKTWLDFGCGTGEITTQLALLGASRVIAVDVTHALVEMTRRRAEVDQVSDRVNAVCGDLTALEPEPVDIVLSYAVLHHLPQRIHQVIPAVLRWLKPGGLFIYCEPVCYLPVLDWIRYHSGVSYDPLDAGERKLTGRDLGLLEQYFKTARRIHFRILNRLNRILPAADRSLRRADAMLTGLPGSRLFAGMVLGVCQRW